MNSSETSGLRASSGLRENSVTNSNIEHDDEISLEVIKDYVKFLIRGFKYLMIASFAGLVLGIVAWFQVKETVTVTFPVQPLPTFENSRYAALNQVRTDSIFRDDSNPITPIPDVLTGKLLSRFLEIMRDDQAIFGAAQSSTLFAEKVAPDDRDKKLVAFVRDVEFKEPATSDMLERGRGSRLWTVTFKSQGVNETLDFLSTWISNTTDKVREELVQEVEQAINFNKLSTERMKEDLLAERRIVINDYNRKLLRTIEILKEDANVARGAGIETNVLTGSVIGDAGGILAIEQGRSERYLRGYVSLEQEIKLLQERETPEPYAAKLDAIDERLEKLEADASIARIQQAFNESPLKIGEFRATALRPTFLNVAPDNSPLIFSLLGIIFGGLAGIFILTMSYIYRWLVVPNS